MITLSEGHYWSEHRECVPVRIETEVADALVELGMFGFDKQEHQNVKTTVYLDPDDALNLAEELKKAVKRLEAAESK